MKSALLVPVLGLALMTMAASGCVENDQSISVARFIAPDPTGVNCTLMATSLITQSNGVLDVGIVQGGGGIPGEGYMAAPVVQNNLLITGTTSEVERDAVQLTGYEVQLQPSADIASLIPPDELDYSEPAAGGLLEPGGALGVNSLSVFLAELVPYKVALALANSNVVQPGGGGMLPTIIARMRPVATHAGNTITGGWVEFPISICKYCLTSPPPPCPAKGYVAGSFQAGGCLPQEDVPITCCQGGSGLLCGKQLPMAAAGG